MPIPSKPFELPSKTSKDSVGAFVDHAPYSLEGYTGQDLTGPLRGKTVAIKDLFDVAGFKTGAGSPAWLATSEPSQKHAGSVTALLHAGSHFVGKTITDELAWSLNGENIHYGTPTNLAAPGRIPGGSSAGSAAAVAADMIDIGLGSDTGGSVRLPASYCGIWGIRPTHGRTDLRGAVALAPSFDTVGWFSKSPCNMLAIGSVLLDDTAAHAEPTRLILAEDCFERVDHDVRQALLEMVKELSETLGIIVEVTSLAKGSIGLADWRNAFRLIQSAEAWDVHGDWVEANDPPFGPGIKDRFYAARDLNPHDIEKAKALRVTIRQRMDDLCSPGTLVVLPGAAGVAPKCGLTGPALDDVRNRALEILCPAGLAGLPQLVFPALRTDDGPVGLSLMGWRGGDEALLALGDKIQGLDA